MLIVAKNDAANPQSFPELQSQKVGKEYLALVWAIPGTPAIVEAPLLRDPGDRRRNGRPSGGVGNDARERIAAGRPGRGGGPAARPNPSLGARTKYEAPRLRADCLSLGTGVWKARDQSVLERQFLHAWSLTVRLPHGGERTFTAPLARELASIWTGIGTRVNRNEAAGEIREHRR